MCFELGLSGDHARATRQAPEQEHWANVIVICIIDYTVMSELLTSPDVVSCPEKAKVVSLFACAS
jgi:hypothetical protein